MEKLTIREVSRAAEGCSLSLLGEGQVGGELGFPAPSIRLRACLENTGGTRAVPARRVGRWSSRVLRPATGRAPAPARRWPDRSAALRPLWLEAPRRALAQP